MKDSVNTKYIYIGLDSPATSMAHMTILIFFFKFILANYYSDLDLYMPQKWSHQKPYNFNGVRQHFFFFSSLYFVLVNTSVCSPYF